MEALLPAARGRVHAFLRTGKRHWLMANGSDVILYYMNLVPLCGDVITGIDNRFVPSTLSSTDIRCFQSSRSLYPFSRAQTEIFIIDGCYQISFNVGEGVSSWFCFSIPSTKFRM